MADYSLNYEKAVEIARSSVYLQSQQFPHFDKRREEIYPDTQIPKTITNGTKEHALYLFYGCSLDSNRKASEVYKAAIALSERIDLRHLSRTPLSDIEKILAEYFGKSKDQVFPAAQILQRNAEELERTYQGDPRNLFDSDVWKTIDNIRKFEQYGFGKAALLIKNYTRFEIWPFDPTKIPIKIDRHRMRICIANKVINYQECEKPVDDICEQPKALKRALQTSIKLKHFSQEDLISKNVYSLRSEKFIVPLMKLFQEVTESEGISAIDLDDSLWAIGSYLCSRNSMETCHFSCNINCPSRPPSDNMGVWFFTRVGEKPLDKRTGTRNFLFK